MDKTVLKRNITDDLKAWDEQGTGPLFVYGLKGVGKAFSCREYAAKHEGFLYYEPDMKVIREGVSIKSPGEYIAAHFGFDTESLKNSFLVINETEKAEEFFGRLFETAWENKSKWIFISDHDYLKGNPQNINKLQMFPVRFDEFLINLGLSEWYVSSVSENLVRKTKLPDIVHNNLISIFEEYIWTGGMPAVVKEYINENPLAITAKQADVKALALNIGLVKNESLKTKCRQILDVTDEQLRKPNRKFMFNLIRSGVTYNMYSEALECLMGRGLLIKLEEMSDSRKFKLFYPEFSFNGTENFDEISDSEFRLREENYVLQTLKEKGITAHFWESGNKAELPFVITQGNGTKAVLEIRNGGSRNSRSILSYKSKHEQDKAVILADSNLVVTEDAVTLPIYSLFCLEKLLKVFV